MARWSKSWVYETEEVDKGNQLNFSEGDEFVT